MVPISEVLEPQVLQQFPEDFRDILCNVLQLNYEVFGGAYPNSIEIKNIQYSCIRSKIDDGMADRFVISVPFSTTQIDFKIFLDINNLDLAPDFIFDGKFLENPDLIDIEENVPSYCKWALDDSASLKNIIKEYYLYYKKEQVALLKKDPSSRVCTEFFLLAAEDKFKAENIDVHVQGDTVSFFIHLKLDFPELHIYKTDENYDKNGASLFVKFNKNIITNSKLHLSSRLQEILNDSNLRIPSIPSTNVPLIEHIPTVTEWLREKLGSISKSYKKSQAFISQLILLHQNEIIEYDAVNFRRAVLLFETEFAWMLTITLGKNYPNTKPNFIITAVEAMEYDSLITEKILDFPYNPHWKPEMIIKKALGAITENLEAFNKKVETKKV